jgi:hypothetical protein
MDFFGPTTLALNKFAIPTAIVTMSGMFLTALGAIEFSRSHDLICDFLIYAAYTIVLYVFGAANSPAGTLSGPVIVNIAWHIPAIACFISLRFHVVQTKYLQPVLFLFILMSGLSVMPMSASGAPFLEAAFLVLHNSIPS